MALDLLSNIDGVTGVLTLNRPRRRNALSHDLIRSLTTECLRLADDQHTRCVVLTGAPPAFCAGLDLREAFEHPDQAGALDTSALLTLYETIERLPKPVIAAVNGPALAGGAGLMTACDLAVFAKSATVGYPGIKQGLVAPIVMPGLLRLVGQRLATRLLLTGEPISARETLAIGLCNAVVPDDDLMPRTLRLADQLASNSPEALAETKRVISQIRGLSPTDAAENQRRLCQSVPLTDESRRALDEFTRR